MASRLSRVAITKERGEEATEVIQMSPRKLEVCHRAACLQWRATCSTMSSELGFPPRPGPLMRRGLFLFIPRSQQEPIMAAIPLTVRGAARLKEELHRLKTVERPAVINAIAEARAQGD